MFEEIKAATAAGATTDDGVFGVVPGRILVAVDGSREAGLAVRAAAFLCRTTGAELHLVHVWSMMRWYSCYLPVGEAFFDATEEAAMQLLEERVREAEGEGVGVRTAHLRRGSPVDEILSLSGEIGAGLIVAGGRKLGHVGRLLRGSVSEGIVHRSAVPVLVIRGGADAGPPYRVVVGEDSSWEAKEAARLGASIGKLLGARILLVRAYTDVRDVRTENRVEARGLWRAQRDLEDRADEFEGALGVRPQVVVTPGDPTRSILNAAVSEEGAVLVALGSRNLSAAERARFGSVSTRVLRSTNGSVLVCPP